MRNNRQLPGAEVPISRIAADVAGLLKREMNNVFEELIEVTAGAWGTPRYRAARQAYRIVILCRSLIEEVKEYESTEWWKEDHDESEEDLPF